MTKMPTMLLEKVKPIKKFFFDWMNKTAFLIVVSIVGVPTLIAWVTGTLDFLIRLLNIPTPLWATIALVLLCYLYTYVKIAKFAAKLNQEDQSSAHLLGLLDNEDLKTLQIIASQEQPLEQNQHIDRRNLPEELNLSPQKTQHCLDKLLEANCIHYDTDNYDTYLRGLTSKGRKLLESKKMLP